MPLVRDTPGRSCSGTVILQPPPTISTFTLGATFANRSFGCWGKLRTNEDPHANSSSIGNPNVTFLSDVTKAFEISKRFDLSRILIMKRKKSSRNLKHDYPHSIPVKIFGQLSSRSSIAGAQFLSAIKAKLAFGAFLDARFVTMSTG